MATYAQSVCLSPNVTKTNGRNIFYIVIHTMEAPESPSTAENIAQGWFAKTVARSSAHWCFDNNSRIRCAYDKDVAWAAPGANGVGLQYELAGYAAQGETQWSDSFSNALLDNVAQQAAADAKKYGIPPVHLTVAQIKAGQKGFIGHIDATNAFRNGVGHTDPGRSFPWDRFLALVKKYMGISSGTTTTTKPVPITTTSGALFLGSTGARVKTLQAGLKSHFKSYAGHLAVDGSYGPATAAAVKEFQKRALAEGKYKSTVDGITGPATIAALASYGIKL